MLIKRRKLPHLYVIGQPLFVTFRLHGSLPPGRHFGNGSLKSGEAFVCMDQLLDREGYGPLYLRMPGIARLVACSIEQGDRGDYSLHAWVVMPNHVHVLITPLTDVPALLQKMKGVTAREANQQLQRVGKPFWQHESYDRLVRNEQEFRRIENYIVQNPVRAGLALCPEKYRWSSAWGKL